MAPERRRLLILLGLLAVVSTLAGYRFWPAGQQGLGERGPVPRDAARASGRAGITAPDVHLHELDAERPRPEAESQRDLFRFRTRLAARRTPPPAPPAPAVHDTAPSPSGPPPAPSLPPIAMRFIGLVEAPQHAQKIAILSDGRGIYQGREGDIIEGRYRILRIGVESVEMAYLDGRGRQTIRLSGS